MLSMSVGKINGSEVKVGIVLARISVPYVPWEMDSTSTQCFSEPT